MGEEIVGRGASSNITHTPYDEVWGDEGYLCGTRCKHLTDFEGKVDDFIIHNVGFAYEDKSYFGMLIVHAIKTKGNKMTIAGVVENDTHITFKFELRFTVGQPPFVNILPTIAAGLKKCNFSYVNFRDSYFTVNHLVDIGDPAVRQLK